METRIHDDARLFDAAGTQRINAANLPFELHVLTSTSASSRAGLEALVHDTVDGPNVVALGVDPTHRWVVARFGTGTGIAPSQWAAIVASGNSEFRDARWADGVLEIANNAARSRMQTSVSVAAHEEPSSNLGIWIGGGLVVAVVAVIGVHWWRKRRRDAVLAAEAFTPGGPYRSPGIVQDALPVSGAQPPVVAARSSEDLLTGYVIGSAVHQPPVVHHHVVHETVHHSPTPDTGSSFGTSASWSGSSFDGGGSFGGGGFDGGGAGSSF